MPVSIFKKLLICLFASSILVGCNISGEPDFDLDDQTSLEQEGATTAPEDKSPTPEDKSSAPEDKIPDAFSFTPLVNAARDVQLLSKMITITGINIDIPVVISGGEYSIDAGSFTSATGTIGNNQTLQLRTQTPVNYSDSKTINITLGSASVDLLVQTLESPKMLSISLLPKPEIRVGDNVVASSACNHCDPSKTRYEWSVEGISQVVSTERFYQVPAEYELKEISVTAIAVNGVGDEGNSMTQTFSLVIDDSTPDDFNFAPQADVARDVQLLSQMITITGISMNIPVVISGGEYSIDGGAFTASAGTISNNQTLQVRAQTSVNYSESKTVSITLGVTNTAFLVSTSEAPEMLTLSLLPTPEIRVGENVIASSTCAHCDPSKTRYEWNVEGVAQVVSTENFYQAPAEYKLKEISVTAIAVNAAGEEGNSITEAFSLVIDDSTPDDFSFAPQTDVTRDVQLLSEIITITGINIDIPVVIAGGEYSIDGGAFTASAGTISNNQTLQVRAQTSVNYSESKTVSITLGVTNTAFLVSTSEAPEMLTLSLLPTPEIRVGENVIASSTCAHCDPSKTRYEWNVEGVAQVVSTENFYQAPAEYKLKEISVTAIAVNAAGEEGNSITEAFSLVIDDSTPDDFSFAPQTDVTRDVQLLSEIITITGINIDIPVVIAGGEYSIDGGTFTTTAGTISNNQTLQLRIQTPLDLSESKSITISLGSSSTSFFVHTSEVPKMLILYFLPGSELAVDKELAVNSDCSHCDPTRTRYEWKVEGSDQVVSNNASYLVPIEHVLKKISITATAINAVGDEGSSITRTYGLNRVREVVGAQGAFAALMFDGTVITWGGANSANNLAVASELTQIISIVASHDAFAAIKNDGTVVTWGDSSKGGDSDSVASQLIGVQSMVAARQAFAAIKDDGTVITWGYNHGGGDSSSVADQLTSVRSITATDYSFAAIKHDGSVVTWGSNSYGGDSGLVADQLADVQSITGSSKAFAAVKTDGSVVTWGDSSYGGDSSSVDEELVDIRSIAAADFAFAAIKEDGSVVTWGLGSYGGYSGSVASQLINIQSIVGNGRAFSALRADGVVITWGYDSYGGDSDDVVGELTEVREIISAHSAFSAIKTDGSVVAWGTSGGDSSEVADQLTLVQAIYATGGAFAAINGEGAIVTWGSANYGADTRSMKDRLIGVKSISATVQAFAAIKEDGSVVAWGDFSGGANTQKVVGDLYDVKSIVAGYRAFAAIRDDGSLFCWGNSTSIPSNSVADQLNDIRSVSAGVGAFAAIKNDGTVVAWGNSPSGGDSSAVSDQLVQVESITGNYGAFAAIKADGSVVTWGGSSGADSSAVEIDLTTIVSIVQTNRAFAAVREDGTVVTWGNSDSGGDSSSVASELTDVKSIAATYDSFAALKNDGSVVTWGGSFGGSNSSSVADQLTNVKSIAANDRSFAAIKEDGSVVTWGDSRFGGDSDSVADQLVDVQSISATGPAFAALKTDGTVVTWGWDGYGADSSSVASQLTQVKSIVGSYGAFAAVKEDGTVVVWGGSVYGAYMQDTTGLQP